MTKKGVGLIGDLRTEALHRALREAEIADDTLLGLLVLAFSGGHVQVQSGARGDDTRWGRRGRVALGIAEGGVLTTDPAALRRAAREMLVEVLSCRVGVSCSGDAALVAPAEHEEVGVVLVGQPQQLVGHAPHRRRDRRPPRWRTGPRTRPRSSTSRPRPPGDAARARPH